MKEELKNTQEPAEMDQHSSEGTETSQVEEQTTPEEEANVRDLFDEEGASEASTLEEAMEIIANYQLKLRSSRQELEESNKQLLRLQADFINFRKRKDKEMSDTVRFANQDLLVQLLPVLDNFDRTLDAISKTDNLTAIKDGISLVENNMKKTLSKIGLEPMVSNGKEFDSELHEAITSIPAAEEDQAGKVVDTIEKGYKLKDRVIRFAKVVVGE